MASHSPTDETGYWEDVGDRKRKDRLEALWRVHSDAVNSAVLAALLPARSDGKVLKTDLYDESMGEGLYGILRERFRCIIGIDLSFSTARAARRQSAESGAACCDVRALPFTNDSFDAVASTSTLDHFHTVQELIGSLAELHRVLRSGGHLVLTLDNAANPIIAARKYLPFSPLRWLGVVPYFVGVNCGPGQLRRLLDRTGFEVLEMGAALHCPRVLAVPMSRMINRRAGEAQKTRFLRFLMSFEKLASGPFRYITGHYVIVKAIKK